MLISSRTLKFLRQSHLYIGIFIAPALLFFALSGAIQTLRLHVVTPGRSYRPPAWILTLATVHKHQSLTAPPVKTDLPKPKRNSTGPAGPPKATAPSTAVSPGAAPAPTLAPGPVPMQIFFLLVAAGLFTSTVTGIIMAYKYNRSKPLVGGLLLAGIVVPLLLLLF